MAITGIGALTGLGSNQSSTQALGQAPQPASDKAANSSGAATPQDEFTPSALNGQQNTKQAAGLFTINQFAPFTAAADAFLAAAPTVPIIHETGALNLSPATGVAANNNLFGQRAGLQGKAANANAAPLAAPASTGANAIASQAPAGTATQPAAATAHTAPATGTASIVEQLQALNNALQALGLSPTDIQRIDQIASVINDFNPAAFTSLAYQLAALTPPAATQQAPANAATAATGGQTTAATAVLGRL
jgi:hypothetical protein